MLVQADSSTAQAAENTPKNRLMNAPFRRKSFRKGTRADGAPSATDGRRQTGSQQVIRTRLFPSSSAARRSAPGVRTRCFAPRPYDRFAFSEEVSGARREQEVGRAVGRKRKYLTLEGDVCLCRDARGVQDRRSWSCLIQTRRLSRDASDMNAFDVIDDAVPHFEASQASRDTPRALIRRLDTAARRADAGFTATTLAASRHSGAAQRNPESRNRHRKTLKLSASARRAAPESSQ